MLRLATDDDFGFVHDVYMDETNSFYMMWEIMPIGDFRPIYDELLLAKNLYIFEHAGQAVGVCKILLHRYRMAHCAYLGGLAMHPDHRSKGFGKVLMSEIFAFVQAHGVKRLELIVEVDNPNAIAFYEKAGFVREGHMKGLTKRADQDFYVDDLLMTRYFW